MKRIRTENNPLFAGSSNRKMVIINNKIEWVGKTYNENYPKMLVDYFDKYKTTKMVKNKETWEKVAMAGDYPTIAGFRAKHKIPLSTWLVWEKKYPWMKEAIELVKDKAYDMLIVNGLNKKYDAQVVKLVGMNEHGITEKKEITTQKIDITDEQKQKMFDEYMRNNVIDWDAVVLEDKVTE